MDSTEHLTAVRRAIDAWNRGDRAGYLALYAEHAALRGYDGVEPGRAGIQRFYEGLWAAFPSTRIELDDVFAWEDKVVCRFRLVGAHLGSFRGLPATGRQFTMPGITILRFEGGRCVERWSQADFLGLLVQLGAMPKPV